MNFRQHLHEFLGDSVDDAEARGIAMTVIANTIKSLKLAVAERLWLARQASRQGDQPASAEHLNTARSLKQRYDAAWAEYRDAANGSSAQATHRWPEPRAEPANADPEVPAAEQSRVEVVGDGRKRK